MSTRRTPPRERDTCLAGKELAAARRVEMRRYPAMSRKRSADQELKHAREKLKLLRAVQVPAQ